MTATLSPPSSNSWEAAAAAPRRYRVLCVSTHPVQYGSPVFREMARHAQLDLQVAYCSLQGAKPGLDPEFGIEVQWDVPVLEGYRWVEVPNRAFRPGLGRFLGLLNPGLWKLVRGGCFDAVLLLTGYVYASFWIALLAAKSCGSPVLFGTDGTALAPRDASRGKIWIKRRILPRVYGLADIAIAASRAGKEYLESLRVPSERIVIEPLVVDNDWWLRQSASVDRAAVRKSWGVSPENPVVLFCAKLQPWKRPADLLRAFAQAGIGNAVLVFAGEGPLRAELEAQAKSLRIPHRVRFLGFVNQSALPSIYTAADIFVLPSEYDPCPAVVCEAMLCGKPVLLSDQIRGRFDQVLHGKTGFLFPCGDVDALARTLREALADPSRLRQMSDAARKQMESCAPRTNVAALLDALSRIAARRGAAAQPAVS